MKAKRTESIVTLIRIPDFEERVERLLSPWEVDALLKLMREESRPKGDWADLFEMQQVNYGHTTIRTWNLHSDTNRNRPIGLLFHEILAVSKIQIKMMEEGIFLRGCISVGTMFYEDDKVFGPTLMRVNNYDNEQKGPPRIVVDPQAWKAFTQKELLKAYHLSTDEERAFLENRLHLDMDNLYYVDYLSTMRQDSEDPKEFLRLLRIHKKGAIQHLKPFLHDSRKGPASMWLVTYHNRVVDSLDVSDLADMDATRGELRISHEELE